MSSVRKKSNHTIKIWDQWIRLFHWSLVVTVGFLLFSGETGTGFFDWHRRVGEIALGLVVFRLSWGLVGSDNARLAGLLQPPVTALQHLAELAKGTVTPHRGHNAAGGWAVLALLILILLQAVSGLFIADEEEWVEGAFYATASADTRDFFYQVHHVIAEALLLLVFVHIVMIAVYFIRAKQNLLMPMITGYMQWKYTRPPPNLGFASFFTGLFIAIMVFAAVGLLLGWF